jgi:hypothetical protein
LEVILKFKLKITKWALTPHAVERLEERKITLKELEIILKSPDEILPQGPKFILIKTFQHRDDNCVAVVVIEKEGKNLWLVITVLVNFQKRK